MISRSASMSAKPWTSAQIFAALKKARPSPAFAVLDEVRNSTGFARTVRTADAIVMGLYPSRGLLLEGFEFKSSRSDWVKELEDPDKAEEIARFCDRWTVITGADGIVVGDELPPRWGLMVPVVDGKRSGTLRVVKEAPALEPQPITRVFFAALMRRVGAPPKSAAIAAIREEEYKRGVEYAEKHSEGNFSYKLREAERRLADLQRSVGIFENASGVKLETWNSGQIGDAVREVVEGRLAAHRRSIENIRTQAKAVLAALPQVEVTP